MRLPRVYYKEFSQTDNILIDNKSKINHLINVLRLSKGSQLELFDGRGKSSICKITSLKRKEIILERTSQIKFQQPEKVKLSILMPYIKKENLFFAIQKVTEIGINKIILFKPDNIDQSIKKKDLTKINEKAFSVIVNSCEQNGSNIIPDLSTYEDISLVLSEKRFSIFFDLDAVKDFNCISDYKDDITLITGPESGFSKRERKLLDAKTKHNISLGRNTLRAETAPITALSIIKSNLGLL